MRNTIIDHVHNFTCWLEAIGVYWPRKLVEATSPQIHCTLIEFLSENMQMVASGRMLYYVNAWYDPGQKDFYYMTLDDLIDNESRLSSPDLA